MKNSKNSKNLQTQQKMKNFENFENSTRPKKYENFEKLKKLKNTPPPKKNENQPKNSTTNKIFPTYISTSLLKYNDIFDHKNEIIFF